MAAPRSLLRLLAALLLTAAPACRCGSSGGSEEGEGAHATSSAPGPDASSVTLAPVTPTEGGLIDPASEPSGALVGDASNRFRDAEPMADLDLEGPADPSCTGAEIAFASVVVDARCAIGSARAKKLRALLERDGGAASLRHDGKVVEAGRISLRLVNTSGASLTLPLSFHAKLPAFSVLAEDERHTLYELEPPPLELRDPGQGNRSHFARIVLPPGGVATATIAISSAIVRVLGRGAGDRCKDAGAAASVDGGACSLTRLPKGRYVLHVGQLLTDVEAGAPARVSWELP